jgi:hypothetical protein
MNWIKVSKKVPKKGQLVLVRGNRETELDSSFGRVDPAQNRIGLVRWESRNYSRTSDMCYYEIVYSKITEWVAVEDSVELPMSDEYEQWIVETQMMKSKTFNDETN